MFCSLVIFYIGFVSSVLRLYTYSNRYFYPTTATMCSKVIRVILKLLFAKKKDTFKLLE